MAQQAADTAYMGQTASVYDAKRFTSAAGCGCIAPSDRC